MLSVEHSTGKPCAACAVEPRRARGVYCVACYAARVRRDRGKLAGRRVAARRRAAYRAEKDAQRPNVSLPTLRQTQPAQTDDERH